MGDSNAVLAEAANRFFVAWASMLRELFEEAKAAGKLRPDVETGALAHLIISSIEGAIILSKASKDPETFARTGRALKAAISGQRTSSC